MELDNKQFLDWIKIELENQNEVSLHYKNFTFVLQPNGKCIEVYSKGKTLANYNTFDEFLANFSIDNYLFVQIVDEIDFED